MPSYHDFFLSYAWANNEEPASGLKKGWVDRFYNALQRDLKELWGRRIDPYRDRDEIKSGEIQISIKAAIKQSIGLVCLLSKEYFQSDWCPLEVQEMLKAIEADPLLPYKEAKKRIVPVLLSPLSDNSLGEFKELLCYPAYRWTNKNKTDWELLEPNKGREGRSMVRQVAIAIKELLENIYGSSGPLYGHKGRIYLSTSPDIDPLRRGIQTTFIDHGYPVLPGGRPLPMNQDAFDIAVKNFLSDSRISVHALGAEATDDAGFIMHHRELELSNAACEAGSLERSLVWIPEDWLSTSPVQQQFVNGLRRGAPLPENVRVVGGTFQHLKERIRDECKSLETPAVMEAPPDARHRLYLVHQQHDKDHSDIETLESWMNNRGLTVLKPLFVGHPSEKRIQKEVAFNTAFAALVYCGVSSAEWADQQFRTLRTAPFPPQRLLFYLPGGRNGDFAVPAGTGIPLGPDPEGGLALVFSQLEQLFPPNPS